MKRIAKIELPLPLGMKHVNVVRVEQDNKDLLIVLQKNLEFGVCPGCGTVSQTLKDKHAHMVIDRPVFESDTKLQVIKRRWKCLNDFCEINTFTEEIEGLPKKHTHTQAFYREAYQLSRRMTCVGVHKHFRSAACRVSLSNIYKKTQELLKNNIAAPANVEARFVGLDEFARGKGYKYGIVLVNLEKNRVIDVIGEGKTKRATQRLLARLNPQKLEAVCIDMYHIFRKTCNEMFPHALVVVDCFHVIKLLNEALDKIRKRVRKNVKDPAKRKAFFKYRGLLLRGLEKLSPQQKYRLWDIFLWNRELVYAYRFKESMRSIYAGKDLGTASSEIERLIKEAQLSNVKEIAESAETLLAWKKEILNFWTYRISNGVTEGKINKIKTLRRKAYNYNNFESLRLKILEQEQD